MPNLSEDVIGTVALAAIGLATLLAQLLASFVKLSAKERADERATRKEETRAQDVLAGFVRELKDQYVELLARARSGGG